MDRLILIDNDALLKLARYGLLDESIALFGCVPTSVRVLATAKYSLFPAKNRLRFCKDEESAARLEAFLRSSIPLDAGAADPDLLDALNAVQNIDAGEALLLAVGATDENTLVITGDKRSLTALCTNDSVTQIANALVGRVVTMEVLFSYLVEYQFAHVQDCVRSNPDVDIALRIVFGVSNPTSFESVQEGLSSYIKNLRAVTRTLLYVQSS
ncbi:hypothetical protein CEN49_04410 [Fischerella thermalis CCMEE 5273]|uniref:Uncharacterized protein n=1 Tax=Chlorogloeopsis fritschii PCC 6912 TaxID=211165 RepID=A0A3S0YFY0_CHLFR|nr:hypothetical protein [Chlorogloeopsis fritschii]PMB10303.1 hypothetical protein CEN49_04410 [Fischerella thermalis CCMEE 5273]RUR83769.1 hypothetical protein PCC6912_20120 [Chlorogloeopsis fritschii PCC 6912]